MSQLTDRLERDLREIAAGAEPSPSAWESLVARLDDDGGSEVALVLAPAPDGSKRPVWIAAAAAAVAVITGSAVLVARVGDDHSVSTDTNATTSPSVAPPSTVTGVAPTLAPTADAFVGTWVSTDSDGSSQTMEIVRSGTDEYDVVVHDDAATVACAGAAATMIGTGRLVTDVTLLIAQPVLTCDDGSVPAVGPPPQADIANLTLDRDPVSDELTDSYGVVWRRAGSNDGMTAPAQATVVAAGSATSGGMWPQSTLDEVRAAQELADAADPASTWQRFAQSAADEEPWEAEILTRFIEEGLGWEEYLPHGGFAYAEGGGGYGEVVLIRCAPGRTNPLAPLYAEIPAEIRGCAPTIDEYTYETVMLSLTQPGRRGASGIWVVEQWEILQSPSEGPLFWLLYPDLGQVRQVVPPPDDDVTALLEAFLQARLDGHGAEQYLLTEPGVPGTQAPLLYATTSGAPYERSTTPEMVQGPVWPTGWREYKVQLFAEDGTVVEQYFHVVRRAGQLGLIYGFAFGHDLPTAENGEPVAVPHSEFGDTVTFTAPPSVPHGDGSEEIQLIGASTDGRVIMAVDPNPELCDDPPEIGETIQPADAEEVARSILALPDIEATEPVPVRIAGTEGLQMDVTSSGRNDCLAPSMWMNDLLADYVDWRMRVYLVEYPESAEPPDSGWRPRVLAITVIASQNDFEDVHEQATPILDSLAFQPG
jgi:hypothetical protein